MCIYRENNEKEKICKLSFWLFFFIDNFELIVYYIIYRRLSIYLYILMMLLEFVKIFGCGY